MASPKTNIVVITKSQLIRLVKVSILFGLTVTILSSLYSAPSTRLFTLAADNYINTAWLGWPIKYIYQTDIFQSGGGTAIEQSVEWVLLLSNWLIWAMVIFSLNLIIKIGQHVYQNNRH